MQLKPLKLSEIEDEKFCKKIVFAIEIKIRWSNPHKYAKVAYGRGMSKDVGPMEGGV